MNANATQRLDGIESNGRTLNDYVDLGDVFEEAVDRPANCNCDEMLDYYPCPHCWQVGFRTPNLDEDTEGDQR